MGIEQKSIGEIVRVITGSKCFEYVTTLPRNSFHFGEYNGGQSDKGIGEEDNGIDAHHPGRDPVEVGYNTPGEGVDSYGDQG